MVGSAAGVLRWLGMAADPPTLVLPWLQVLHALSFGATHLGTLVFLARNAPAGKAATAQGYFAITAGLVMAAATGISGVLYQDFGSRAYVAMALVAIAGGACGFIAHRTRRNPTG
jgi:PPP family 3-phenylpropionic acid transporter